MPVRDHDDYKDALRELVDAVEAPRGVRRKLAEAIGCTPSYFSQILHGHLHLTLDQAAELADHLAWTDNETNWFLTCVQLARAGSPRLKLRLERRKQELKRQPNDALCIRAEDAFMTSTSAPFFFESVWPQIIHTALDCPDLCTAEALGRRFKLDVAFVKSVLALLGSVGLLQIDGDRVASRVASIRWKLVDPMAPNLVRCHLLKAAAHLDRPQSILALSAGSITLPSSAVKDVQNLFKKLQSDLVAVSDSPRSDDVYCTTFMFYKP